MTEMFHNGLLQTDLYSDPIAVRFVECLLSPEIDSASEEELPKFLNSVLPADDILSAVEYCSREAEQKLKEYYRIKPFFTALDSSGSPITLSSNIPETKQETEDLIAVGKCLAFATAASCVFFTTECFHDGYFPMLGEISMNAKWGICVSGSSVQGQSFVQIVNVSDCDGEISFDHGEIIVKRQKHCLNKMSGFFDFNSYKELENVLKKLPFISSHVPGLSENQALKNFAIILKALSSLNYSK